MERIEHINTKKFRIEQIIHRNESAGTDVYIAIDDDLKRRVVLKSLRYHNAEQKRTLLEEVSNQISLERFSDFVPKIYNCFLDDKKSQITIEMQYVEGKSLRTVIDSANKLRKDKIWYEKEYDLLMKVVKAVSYIHKFNGFVHKDLKPENIISISGRNAIYVLDYGISGLASADKGTGTARYMAPEQISRANTNFVYQATDVFALGQIALEMFGLEPVQYGVDAIPDNKSNRWADFADLSGVGGEFYPELKEILCKALSLNPKERYENASMFYEALNRGRRTVHGDKNYRGTKK